MGKNLFKKRQAARKKAQIKFNLHLSQSRRQYHYEKESKILENVFESCLSEILAEVVKETVVVMHTFLNLLNC